MSSTLPGEARPLLERLLEDLRRRFEAGQPTRIEAYLGEHPELRQDREALLDLLFNEILWRERNGEKPVLEEYVRRFPELAEELAVQFEVDRELGGGPDFDATAHQSFAGNTPPWVGHAYSKKALEGAETIPGYDVVRELGRGGMGVVFQARQRSLNRMVALKMVLSGSFARPEELTRFRTEAEAAARLQHPNIVQVHEIGEHNGQPFYSLEYVDGGSLSQKLRGVPQPPMAAAALLEVLARAVHYAHQHDIVHRDLKPANILLASGGDSSATVQAKDKQLASTPYGLPKITDFGLAKLLDRDSQLTQSGDMLGSPSYMAPEQTGGHNHTIGPATDVYALGAILYEMLTGRPPFRGTNLAETILQVQTIDPVPPRRLQPTVPVELQTIAMKCLRKEAAKRYASAQALADDLACFQAGLPIQARPIGRWGRLVKWARRRPALAGLVGVSIAASLALLIGGWLSALSLERKNRESERLFQKALLSVDQMLNEVGEVDLENVPRMVPVREKLLLRARESYAWFLREKPSDADVRRGAGRADLGLGDVHAYRGKYPEAETSYRNAIELFGPLAAEFSERSDYLENLGRAHHSLAEVLRRSKRHDDSAAAFAIALTVRRELVAEHPGEAGFARDLAASVYFHGVLLDNMLKKAEAEQALREAVKLQEALIARFSNQPHAGGDLARSLNQLGVFLHRSGQPHAEVAIARAVALQEKLADQFPEVPGYRQKLARYYNNLARHQQTKGEHDNAETTYVKAQARLRRLVDDFPEIPDYGQELAATESNLGRLLRDRLRLSEAEAAFRSATALRRKLVADNPAPRLDDRSNLAETLTDLGFVLSALGRSSHAEAIDCYREAAGIHEQLAEAYPKEPRYHSGLGSALNHLARLRYLRSTDPMQTAARVAQACDGDPRHVVALSFADQVELREARALLNKAIEEHGLALAADPKNPEHKRFLLHDHVAQAAVLLELGEYQAVAVHAEKLPELFATQGEYLRAARFLAQAYGLALAGGERDKAELLGDKVISCLERAVELGLADAKVLRQAIFQPFADRERFKNLLARLAGKG